MTRVQEIREKRRFPKSQLARMAGMPPQTLQRIEDGSIKTLTPKARRLLAGPLGVLEEELLMPVGTPLRDDEPPVMDLIYHTLLDVLAELRKHTERLNALGSPTIRAAADE